MHPNLNNSRRTENSLQIWILEAKGVPAKKKYFCELSCDKTLFGRTTAKLKTDLCFWGESFEFNHLPKLETVCVNLYREVDKKKRNKDRSCLIGFIQIPVSELISRQPIEKWYNVHCGTVPSVAHHSNHSVVPSKAPLLSGVVTRSLGGDSSGPALRVKARYQSIDILPERCYKRLDNFVKSNYLALCTLLESKLPIKAKEDLATNLVYALHCRNRAKDFLCDLIMSEVKKLDNEHLMFRGNSLATKAVENYLKLVGGQYLSDTLQELVRSVLEADDDCEVDPVKVHNNQQLERNRKTLLYYVELAWGKIVNSVHYFPSALRDVFFELRNRLGLAGRSELGDYLVSSSVFLRFLCPAILSPSLFSLMTEYPSDRCARSLTLIAKSIQTLANFSQFQQKEQYMQFMNQFVEQQQQNMRAFLITISAPLIHTNDRIAFVDQPPLVDFGQQMALLHLQFTEALTQFSQDSTLSMPVVKDLFGILNDITAALNHGSPNSSIGQSSDYETTDINTGNVLTPLSEYDNAIESCRLNGIRTLSLSHPPPPDVVQSVQRQIALAGRRSSPAHDLNTSDDYVWYSAIDENIGLRQSGIKVQMARQKHHHGNNVVTGAGKVNGVVDSVAVANGSKEQQSMSPKNSKSNADANSSQLSLASSSGYQSLPQSNTSSPVETSSGTPVAARVCAKSSSNASTSTSDSSNASSQQLQPNTPLSFANPLYSSVQIGGCNGHTFLLSSKSMPNGINGSEVNLSPPSTPIGLSFSMIPTTNNSRSNATQTANTRQSIGSIDRHQTPCQIAQLVHSGNVASPQSEASMPSIASPQQPLTTPTSSTLERRAPRTNPRCTYGQNSTTAAIVSPMAGLRRTQTDMALLAEDDDESAEEKSYSAETDFEMMRRKYKKLQMRLGEAEKRECRWKQKYEDAKPKLKEQLLPILLKLRAVEKDLQTELNSSHRKEQIIESQKQKISSLEHAISALINGNGVLNRHNAATVIAVQNNNNIGSSGLVSQEATAAAGKAAAVGGGGGGGSSSDDMSDLSTDSTNVLVINDHSAIVSIGSPTGKHLIDLSTLKSTDI